MLVYDVMLSCSQATSTASTNATTTTSSDASESLKVTYYLNDEYNGLL